MNFHEARIDLLQYILNKGPEYLEQIEKRNAYDKIIRNYHQCNAQGEKVYENLKLGKIHLVHSKKALKIIEEKSTWKKARKFLHYEHSVPIKVIRGKLEELIKKSPNIKDEDVKEIMDCTSIVVITKKEKDLLDKNPIIGTTLKDKMPDDTWPLKGDEIYSRFWHQHVKIELEDGYMDKKL